MFDDVPPLLTAFVELLLDPAREDFRYAQVAAIVTAFYLREQIETTTEGLNFFRFETTPSGHVSPHHFAKVIAVGETLFLLRNCRGFDKLCQKLQTGNLEAEYFALLTARQFLKAGFEVSAREETGTKQDDFDFDATRSGEAVSVEATRLGNKNFSRTSVMNRLKKKRSQLPRTLPGVIFCEHSSRWFEQVPHLELVLGEITKAFFRNTQRVNAVVYMVQSYTGYSEMFGALNAASLSFFNERARIGFSDWAFLREGRFAGEVEPSPELTAFARDSEFYRWVDYITGRLRNAKGET